MEQVKNNNGNGGQEHSLCLALHAGGIDIENKQDYKQEANTLERSRKSEVVSFVDRMSGRAL